MLFASCYQLQFLDILSKDTPNMDLTPLTSSLANLKVGMDNCTTLHSLLSMSSSARLHPDGLQGFQFACALNWV